MFQDIEASAAYSDGQYMLSSDFLELIGREITYTYYNGSDYVQGVFRYDSTQQSGFSVQASGFSDVSQQPFLFYVATDFANINLDTTAISVQIEPQYSIINTDKIYSWVALSSSYSVSSDAYRSSEWDWYYSTSGAVKYISPEYNQGWRNASWNQSQFVFVPAIFDSQSVGSGYASTARFYGTKGSGNSLYMFLCIGVPYISSDASASSGTFSTTATSPDINVNVDVDLTETNGILSGIKQSIDNLVQGILNGLKALFIPSDDFMDGFKSDMEGLLADHLGGLYEAEQIMVDSFEQLPNVAAKSEIYIPPAELPLGGETFVVGGWHVPLKVSGLPAALYDGIAFIIDFLCIAAFLRMCRNKLEIFLNPDSEVIEQ